MGLSLYRAYFGKYQPSGEHIYYTSPVTAMEEVFEGSLSLEALRYIREYFAAEMMFRIEADATNEPGGIAPDVPEVYELYLEALFDVNLKDIDAALDRTGKSLTAPVAPLTVDPMLFEHCHGHMVTPFIISKVDFQRSGHGIEVTRMELKRKHPDWGLGINEIHFTTPMVEFREAVEALQKEREER